ncbi:hypothetical protein KL928_004949 [Ogataea angusta]|uniref:Uncharacterized protein n=1 Tax=Pichia angusta TaxID=870730 RepID=A0AAN6DBB1_PICAN|nr:uncharacterized protein KL928_004949 [Ogataea angusta]KAG7816393.1 hypothetical protein KL928_004949 [Ogataea angusta]
MIQHFARQALCVYRKPALKERTFVRITSRHASFSSETNISVRALLESNLRPTKSSEVFESTEGVRAREALIVKILLSSHSSRTCDELQEWKELQSRFEAGIKGQFPTSSSGGARHSEIYKSSFLSKINTSGNHSSLGVRGISGRNKTEWTLDPQTTISDVILDSAERNKVYELFKHACQGQGFIDESVRSHIFNLFTYGELSRLENANHLFITDLLLFLVKILHEYSIKSTYATFMIVLHKLRSSSARRRLIGHIQKQRSDLELDLIGQTSLAKEDLLGRKIKHQHLLEKANRFDEESSRFILAFLLDISPKLAVGFFNNRYVIGPEPYKLNSSIVEVFVDFWVPRKRYKELFKVFFFIERNLGLSMNYFLLHTLSGMIMEWSSFPGQLITEPILLYYHYLRNKRGFKIPKALVARVNERLKPEGGYDKNRASNLIRSVAKSNSNRLTI